VDDRELMDLLTVWGVAARLSGNSTPPQELSVSLAVVGERLRPALATGLIDRTHREGRLVRVDPDRHHRLPTSRG